MNSFEKVQKVFRVKSELLLTLLGYFQLLVNSLFVNGAEIWLIWTEELIQERKHLLLSHSQGSLDVWFDSIYSHKLFYRREQCEVDELGIVFVGFLGKHKTDLSALRLFHLNFLAPFRSKRPRLFELNEITRSRLRKSLELSISDKMVFKFYDRRRINWDFSKIAGQI